jgi:hypothetical protein
MILSIIGITVGVTRKDLKQTHLVILMFCGVSIGIYLLMPEDWMGEYRFATSFILFFWMSVVVFMDFLGLTRIRLGRPCLQFAVVSLTCLLVIVSVTRSLQFIESAPLSLMAVAADAEKFNKYAQKLINASILLPDVGGTLMYSNLRVYDLAGLCDKKIAKTLGTPEFADYIFQEAKPTFIHMHGPWISRSGLLQDGRLSRDYILFHESYKYKKTLDYVRKTVYTECRDFLSGIR